MRNPTILIAGVDEVLRQNLKGCFNPHEFEIVQSSGTINQQQIFETKKPDLVIIGANCRKTDDGLGTVSNIRRQYKKIPIILIPKYSSEARVIAALRAGVTDYFKWPYSEKEVIASIRRNLSDFYRQPEVSPKTIAGYRDSSRSMIGQSKSMREIKAYLLKVASTDSTVLIAGETGTG